MLILKRARTVRSWMSFARMSLVLAGILLSGAMSNGAAAQAVEPPGSQPAAAGPAVTPASAPAAVAGPSAAAAVAVPAAAAKPPLAQENSDTKKAVKKHKVFTDDEVYALRYKGGLANDDDTGSAMIYGSMGACDTDCEQEVKEKLGVTAAQEGEWKLQMTAARREIGEDHRWRELYGRGQQTMKNVCGLRAQIQNAPVPSGDDYQSRLERARQQKMFEDEETAMGQSMENIIAAVNQHLEQFSSREPARAVMMAVIAERLFDSCPETDSK